MAIVVGTKKAKAPRVEVKFGYMRDDEQEWFVGQAALALDAAGMRRTLLAAEKESANVLDALFSTVAKMMDNTDGVPDGWKPKVLRRAIGGAVTEDPELAANTDEEVSFRVPFGEHKGQIWPMSRVGEFMDPANWSTRARWNYLINVDEGAVVDAEDVTKFFEQLVGAAAKRPTGASS